MEVSVNGGKNDETVLDIPDVIPESSEDRRSTQTDHPLVPSASLLPSCYYFS